MWSPSLLGISNYIGGNGGTAKGLMADLRTKPLKIANAFSKESATDWSENRKIWVAFRTLQFTGGYEWMGP